MGYYKKFLNDHHKTLREITHVLAKLNYLKDLYEYNIKLDPEFLNC